ncbi:MAG TPA: hypothetical protein VHG09_13850, partial [Longimicrobiales bacterium]|nr:hypothetical protein [Longimicrobiales bacterium]
MLLLLDLTKDGRDECKRKAAADLIARNVAGQLHVMVGLARKLLPLQHLANSGRAGGVRRVEHRRRV